MIYFAIIVILVIIDLVSKQYVKKNFKLHKEYYLCKFFNIYHIKNEGIAYGFFKNSKKLIFTFLSICLIIVCILFLLAFKENSKLKKLAYSFALGGAFGNFIDRVINKNVTDFFHIKGTKSPIFNFADIFLIISPIFLIIKELKDEFFKKF